jgi:hypothetical protein
MNAYKAVVIHNIGIMSLTGLTLVLTDGNLWSLLILFALCKTKKNEGDVE